MNAVEKLMVRRLKEAAAVKVQFTTYDGTVITLTCDWAKPIHDIAIAMQDYYNNRA